MLDASTLGSDPAKYREVAETLRGIAHGVGLDQDRLSHLQFLANSFESIARRLEGGSLAEAAAQ